ncbi:MAG: hypothetical protein RLN62_07010 [Rickettsiales bacterium]
MKEKLKYVKGDEGKGEVNPVFFTEYPSPLPTPSSSPSPSPSVSSSSSPSPEADDSLYRWGTVAMLGLGVTIAGGVIGYHMYQKCGYYSSCANNYCAGEEQHRLTGGSDIHDDYGTV